MTVSTANLHEYLLAALNLFVLEVTCTRDRKSAVPYHECPEVVVGHLRFEVMPLVVELVRLRTQQVCYSVLDALFGTVAIVRRRRVSLNLCYDALVLRHCLCPCVGGVELRTIATTNVGYVPDSVSTCTVLQ